MKSQLVLTIISFILTVLPIDQDEVQKLTDYITGGQLVIYYQSSYLSDNTASSITYVDFCSDGRYRYSYDSSYTVKGTQNTSNRNNRANGAGVAENEGEWSVLKFKGSLYLEIIDFQGKKAYYPIDINNLMSGSWKQGRTSYAFAVNKGNCY